MLTQLKAIAIVAPLALAVGCGQTELDPNDVIIHTAQVVAVNAPPGSPTPAYPWGPFQIYAWVSGPPDQLWQPAVWPHAQVGWWVTWRQRGDFFRAAVHVGTPGPGNQSRYGSQGGVKFELSFFGASPIMNEMPPDMRPPPNDPTRHWYWAVSERLFITCTAQNQLKFSVVGLSSDVLQFRVRTAGMGQSVLAQQARWTRTPPGPPLHGGTAPTSWADQQRFYCLLEEWRSALGD